MKKRQNILIKKYLDDPYLFYTGLQIINPRVFDLIKDISFSMNKLYDLLIAKNILQGALTYSNIAHIGDINAFNKFKR